jgi:hypothetical protein
LCRRRHGEHFFLRSPTSANHGAGDESPYSHFLHKLEHPWQLVNIVTHLGERKPCLSSQPCLDEEMQPVNNSIEAPSTADNIIRFRCGAFQAYLQNQPVVGKSRNRIHIGLRQQRSIGLEAHLTEFSLPQGIREDPYPVRVKQRFPPRYHEPLPAESSKARYDFDDRLFRHLSPEIGRAIK